MYEVAIGWAVGRLVPQVVCRKVRLEWISKRMLSLYGFGEKWCREWQAVDSEEKLAYSLVIIGRALSHSSFTTSLAGAIHFACALLFPCLSSSCGCGACANVVTAAVKCVVMVVSGVFVGDVRLQQGVGCRYSRTSTQRSRSDV